MDESAVVPYDDQWPHLFEVERQILEGVLAPWLRDGIHHVGSTAIPGLAAKPVIDMIAGVARLEEARAALEPLAAHGYVHGEHRPEALWFRKPGGDWCEATHALHLTEPAAISGGSGSPFAMRCVLMGLSQRRTNAGSSLTPPAPAIWRLTVRARPRSSLTLWPARVSSSSQTMNA